MPDLGVVLLLGGGWVLGVSTVLVVLFIVEVRRERKKRGYA